MREAAFELGVWHSVPGLVFTNRDGFHKPVWYWTLTLVFKPKVGFQYQARDTISNLGMVVWNSQNHAFVHGSAQLGIKFDGFEFQGWERIRI